MDQEKIYQEILKHAQDGGISCRQCFDVASQLDISLKVVGQACNDKDIKIRACQLGCFK